MIIRIHSGFLLAKHLSIFSIHIGILNKEIIFGYECLWHKNTVDYTEYVDYRLL